MEGKSVRCVRERVRGVRCEVCEGRVWCIRRRM